MIALEHIALWTTQLERLKDFYVQHFDGVAGPRYENPSKDFASYFIAFAGGSRLEIMQMPSVPRSLDDVHRQFTGFIHIAFAPDSAGEIDQLTATLAANLARSSALIWALVALPLCHTTRFPDHFSGVKAIDAVL